MPDYLSCGACHAEFEVIDFYRFVDHKATNCHARYSPDQLLSRAESVLECSKCLKKYRTPWALLRHLESDHCMALARTLLLPTDADPDAAYSRQRSAEQSETTEACTQTTRSCLRRQVCPYEDGLPDDCCLKATKEQRASDSGCCCMDSFGAGRRGGACGGSGCGGGSGGERQTDCCLAIPKKRRLLTAFNGENDASPASLASPAASAAAVRVATPLTSMSAPAAVECCALKADCPIRLRNADGQVRSVECQTDFVGSLLDLDVELLLDDATGVDVPTSLVNELSEASEIPVVVTGNTSALPLPIPAVVSAVAVATTRQPLRLHPAPSKAIQTVGRVAASPITLTAQVLPTQPPLLPASSAAFLCPAPVTLSLPFQQQQQVQSKGPPEYLDEQHLHASRSLPLPLPPLDTDGDAGDAGGSDEPVKIVVGPTPTGSGTQRPANKDMKFKCSQCSRTFRQNIHLRKHVMSQHSHSKPHKCPSCDYTTVEKSHLTVHIRKHTGERPYSCRDCDYSTAQNCTLKAHYLRKHPGSVVQCARCSTDFVTEHERDKHERNCSPEFQQDAAT